MTFYGNEQIPYDLQQRIDAELDRGEKLRWSGRPRPTRFLWYTLPAVLFGIPWTAFAVFWMFGAAGFHIPDFKSPESYFCLFGVPFVLVGLGMLSTPWWMIRRARRTVYALTDRRAIILIAGRATKVHSCPAERLSVCQKRIRPDGSGDLIFLREPSYDGERDRSNFSTLVRGFFGIPRVNEVEDILQEIRENAKTSETDQGAS